MSSSSDVEVNNTDMSQIYLTQSKQVTKTFSIFTELDLDICNRGDFFYVHDIPVDLKKLFPQLSQTEIEAFPYKSLVNVAPNSWTSFLNLTERPEQVKSGKKRPVLVTLFAYKIDGLEFESACSKLGCLATKPIMNFDVDEKGELYEVMRQYNIDIKNNTATFRDVSNLITSVENINFSLKGAINKLHIELTQIKFELGFLRSDSCLEWFHSVRSKLKDLYWPIPNKPDSKQIPKQIDCDNQKRLK